MQRRPVGLKDASIHDDLHSQQYFAIRDLLVAWAMQVSYVEVGERGILRQWAAVGRRLDYNIIFVDAVLLRRDVCLAPSLNWHECAWINRVNKSTSTSKLESRQSRYAIPTQFLRYRVRRKTWTQSITNVDVFDKRDARQCTISHNDFLHRPRSSLPILFPALLFSLSLGMYVMLMPFTVRFKFGVN